jgi:2-polyprenyl-6-methoxyphenol hydroxylase-like FAD-dependent oxidoreductase
MVSVFDLLMCSSLVRRSLGCESLSWDYQEKGVVATLHLARPPPANTTAFQRFLPSGPVGRLPTLFLVFFFLLIFLAFIPYQFYKGYSGNNMTFLFTKN